MILLQYLHVSGSSSVKKKLYIILQLLSIERLLTQIQTILNY